MIILSLSLYHSQERKVRGCEQIDFNHGCLDGTEIFYLFFVAVEIIFKNNIF